MSAMQLSLQRAGAAFSVAAAAAAAPSRQQRARVRALPERSAGASEQQQEQQPSHQQLPRVWCSGLLRGTFGAEVAAAFPAVTWRPASLARVLYFGLPAAAAGALINSQLAAALCTGAGSSSSSSSSIALPPGAACAGLPAALLHAGQEAVFALLLPAACWCALGGRVLALRGSRYWAAQTLATCALLFPLVDPLLTQLWQPAVQAVLGGGSAAAVPLVSQLQQAAAAGDWPSLGLHILASGLLGPAWEEVFWRGFFLTALSKVLPLPACVALSASAFAGLHLSPSNAAPLAVLGAAADLLYLRSGGNLLPPLLLHALWNTSQVLQIALLNKDSFV